MMSFLGMTNFCRNWIPGYEEETTPLMKLIYEQQMAAHYLISWTPEAENASVKIKQLLVSSAVLGLPDYKKPFEQTVDAKVVT